MNCFEKGGIRFHLFPDSDNNIELYYKWIAATGLENIKITKQNRGNYYLCEDHFRGEDYNTPLEPKSRLKRYSVPSVCFHHILPQHRPLKEKLQQNVYILILLEK